MFVCRLRAMLTSIPLYNSGDDDDGDDESDGVQPRLTLPT